MLFFWTVYSKENPERNVSQILKKILSSKTVFFNIDNNNTSFPEQQIILHAMISEEPCDTEDWSIFRTENKILPFWNKLH